MFGTIRRHQKWLWLVIITFTIISFVYFFSPYNRQGAGRGTINLGSISGVPVGVEEYANTKREIYLRHFFMTGNWPTEQDAKRTEAETYQRLFLIQKQKQYEIHVSPEAAARFTRDSLMHQFERNGPVKPTDFVQKVLEPQGFQMTDLQRFVEHELGAQELITILGLSGQLATPQEIQALYIREHEEVDAEALMFSASNFLASVTVTPEAISQFYSNRLANYRLPNRIQVRYVKFGVSNYLAQAEEYWAKTNLNEIVDGNVQQMGTNLFRDAKTPEESKAKIREEIIRTRALAEAGKKARDFARPLIEDATSADALDPAAKTNDLVVSVSAPFDKEAGPSDLEVGMDFIKSAFTRTPAQPFGPPITGRDGVYVFALDKTLPSEIPPLELIRDRVTADYKLTQAAMAARQAGGECYRIVTNALAQGKDFAAAATEAKAQPVQIPPFSISTRSLAGFDEQGSLDQLKQIAFSTADGKVSEFQPTREGGLLLHVKAHLPINPAKMAADLPAYSAYVRQTRQNEAFSEWFRKEAEKNLRDTPLFKQPDGATTPRTARS